VHAGASLLHSLLAELNTCLRVLYGVAMKWNCCILVQHFQRPHGHPSLQNSSCVKIQTFFRGQNRSGKIVLVYRGSYSSPPPKFEKATLRSKGFKFAWGGCTVIFACTPPGCELHDHDHPMQAKLGNHSLQNYNPEN
jgi:hypothetical protein